MALHDRGGNEFTTNRRQRGKRALDVRLHNRLLAYAALAAGATAVASPAHAEVIYTPVHTSLNLDYYLDLNNDGINDFRIHSYYISGVGDLEVFHMGADNKVVTVQSSGRTWAAALPAGAVVGKISPLNVVNPTFMADMNSWFSYGVWPGVKNHYLGFAFNIDGVKHFGWARLSFNSFFYYGCIAGITGYAYETEPGKAIIAGDKGTAEQAEIRAGSLGLLASGTVGLSLWRKEQ